MLKTLLLVTSFFAYVLFPSDVLAASICKKIFSVSQTNASFPILEQTIKMITVVENLKLFESSNRKRRKEMEHMRSDLKGIEENLKAKIDKQPYIAEFLQKWQSFNEYWLQKALEFQDLPIEKQRELKSYMEIPLSLSIKHFISFLEAPRHTKWKLNRLNSLLTIHEAHRNIDVEAALFIINREALKTYSRWDFVRCRY